jgi:ATP-binding cassette subfamily F protein uup
LSGPPVPRDPIAKKLTYREQEELGGLPARIEALEATQRALEASIAAPDFYKESADDIRQALARREAVHEELLQAYARWDELESRAR